MNALGYTRVAPPDTDGAAGTTHYVQAVNGQGGTNLLFISKDDRSTPQGPYRLGDLAPRNHPCDTDAGGDPIIVFDAVSRRWWLSEFTSPEDNCGFVCHYVSETEDPLGAFNFYAYEAPHFPDYPHYGTDGDQLFYGAIHDFNCRTFAFEGTSLLAFERQAMIEGRSAKWVYKNLGRSFFPMPFPATVDNTEAGGAEAIFTRTRPTSGVVELFNISVDWSSSKPTISRSSTTDIHMKDTYSTKVPDIPQKGVSRKLDTLADRDMYSSHFRSFEHHDTIVGCRTVLSGGRAAPLWFEAQRNKEDGKWKLKDSDVIAPKDDSTNRWMCSAAIDREGTVALGYSYSNPNNSSDPYVGIGYKAVSPSSEEYKLATGSGVQVWADRWGDYMSLEVDPSDGCTFWITTEIVDVHDQWATRVGSFKSTECNKKK